jgi:uncharacterized membrane protein
VLTDVGIDAARLGSGWAAACQSLAEAVKRRDLAAFYRSLESLGPVLGSAHPRSADDVNELPDEVQ